MATLQRCNGPAMGSGRLADCTHGMTSFRRRVGVGLPDIWEPGAIGAVSAFIGSLVAFGYNRGP